MNLEEIQKNFELALAELDIECRKNGYVQESVICDEVEGVSITFDSLDDLKKDKENLLQAANVRVNYSNVALMQNAEEYLKEQEEKHRTYQRVLQNHKLEMKKELQMYNSWIFNLLKRSSRPAQKDLEATIQREQLKLSFDKVFRDGALLGHYFFVEMVGDVPSALKKTKENLVTLTSNILENTKELYRIDKERLDYLEKRNRSPYGKSKG